MSDTQPRPAADTVRPFYEQDGITIYHGDCLDVLPKLAPVDLVVTSPAYNLGVNPGGQFGHWKDGDNSGGKAATRKWSGNHGAGIGYDCHADAMPYPEYRAWQHEVLTALWTGLSDRGAIYYNHRPRVQRDGLLLPLDLNPDLPIRQIITWARAGGYCYTPTAYVPMYEWIIVFAKAAFRLRERKASGAGDLWQIPAGDEPAAPCTVPRRPPGEGYRDDRSGQCPRPVPRLRVHPRRCLPGRRDGHRHRDQRAVLRGRSHPPGGTQGRRGMSAHIDGSVAGQDNPPHSGGTAHIE